MERSSAQSARRRSGKAEEGARDPCHMVSDLTAGWFKRFLLRIEFVFRDTNGESKLPPLPDHLRMEIARCILPDIVAYFESERGQREFAEWKKSEENKKEIIKNHTGCQ